MWKKRRSTLYNYSKARLVVRLTRMLNVASTFLLLIALLWILVDLGHLMAPLVQGMLGAAIVLYLIVGIDGGVRSRRIIDLATDLLRENP